MRYRCMYHVILPVWCIETGEVHAWVHARVSFLPYLSICLVFIHLPIYLTLYHLTNTSICLSIYLNACFSTYRSSTLSVYLFTIPLHLSVIYLSFNLTLFHLANTSICLSIYVHSCFSTYLSLTPSVSLSTCLSPMQPL